LGGEDLHGRCRSTEVSQDPQGLPAFYAPRLVLAGVARRLRDGSAFSFLWLAWMATAKHPASGAARRSSRPRGIMGGAMSDSGDKPTSKKKA
jgi:hypothetical protein